MGPALPAHHQPHHAPQAPPHHGASTAPHQPTTGPAQAHHGASTGHPTTGPPPTTHHGSPCGVPVPFPAVLAYPAHHPQAQTGPQAPPRGHNHHSHTTSRTPTSRTTRSGPRAYTRSGDSIGTPLIYSEYHCTCKLRLPPGDNGAFGGGAGGGFAKAVFRLIWPPPAQLWRFGKAVRKPRKSPKATDALGLYSLLPAFMQRSRLHPLSRWLVFPCHRR